ncbi:hypothetical protein A7K94_0212300, partial [Modestobacter sp. VKM Ac-2676]
MTASADQAVTAAVAVARQHGIRVADPVLLSWGVNAVVHLPPAPLVARVAVHTPLLRPQIHRPFAREVALGTALAAGRRGRSVPPSDPAAARPARARRADPVVLASCRRVAGSTHRAAAGRALAELHEVLGTLPPLWTGSPLDRPLEDLAVFVDSGTGLGAD